jgi:hypothetical protein
LYRSISKRELNFIMKYTVRLIIFVVGFGLSFISIEAYAKDDKSTANTAGLSKGREKAFEQYITDNFTPFIEQDEWKIFVEVVTLYNQSPSKLSTVNAETQQQFKSAVKLLNHAMNSINDENAKSWNESIRKTAHNIDFLWRVDWETLTPAHDTERIIGEPISMLNGF